MEKTVNPLRVKFFSFLLRLIPACLMVILFFYLIAPFFIGGHLKLFTNQLTLLHPEYEIINNDTIQVNQLDYIRLYIKVNKNPTLPGSSVNKGTIVKVQGQASSLCTAPIIIFSLILAWPGLAIGKRMKALLIAVPLTILLAMLDYPIIFIADIESVFTDAPLQNSMRLVWKHLMNNGGRQFLGLLISLIAVGLATMDSPKQVTVNPEKVGRNDPCPCGSGKKFKNCCLR